METIAGVVLGAGAAGAALGWAAWRLRRRAAAEAARAAALEREAEQGKRASFLLGAVLDGAGGGFALWRAGEPRPTLSPGLAAALGVPGAGDLARITSALATPDRDGFARAVERLRETGAGFALIVAAVNGRSFHAAGRRIGGADAVFLIDRSADAAHAAQLSRIATAAGAERDRLQAALDALPLPVWRRDAGLALAWCNAAYGRAVDAAANEAVAAQRELLGAAAGRALARRAADTAKPASERQRVVTGGQRRLMQATELPLDRGQPAELVGFAQDLTENAELKASLERHLAAHGEVLESLASAIAIYGADTRLVFFNSSFARLWRLEAAWLSAKPTIGEVLEAMRERRRLPEYVDFKAFKADTVKLFTGLIEPKDEMMHLPDETALRTLIAPHPLGGLMFIYEDVTDRLALERSVNTLTEVQRETLNNLHEGVAVFGGDGRLRLNNPEFARLWNLAPEDLADGPHIADVIEKTRTLFPAAGDWPERKAALVARITEPEPRAGRLERLDGKAVDYALTPLPDGACLLTYLDVTDRNRVERALRERNLALEAADRLKTEFIANVSYELRTPLNAIIGFAEILTNEFFGALNERQKEYARNIIVSSHALRNLINDILDLATIEAGYMTLDRGVVDISALLNAVAQLMRERAKERELQIGVDCPADIGAVPGDERRLKQALFNLVSNAVKFTPHGGRITLKARREGGEVALIVADTGVGIAQEDHERVFGKFERGSQGRQAGAGLGLALVKSLIELHQGRVRMESERGKGTTVTCLLPAVAPEPAPAPLTDEA
jgi:signal transduction histidine kinase